MSEPTMGYVMQRVHFRETTFADELFLWEMLILAAHMHADGDASVEVAQQHPYLAKYLRGWGRPGDIGVIAVIDGGHQVGAAWLRHLTGAEHSYPEASPAYPELGLAVLPEYSGRGLGAALLGQIAALARPTYPGIVLSVRADNPARRLYERHGYLVIGEIVNRVGTCSYVMELRLHS